MQDDEEICTELQPGLVEKYEEHIGAMKRVSEYETRAKDQILILQKTEDHEIFSETYNITDGECFNDYRGDEGEFHAALVAGQPGGKSARKFLKNLYNESTQSREDFESAIIEPQIQKIKECFQTFKNEQVKIKEKVLYASKPGESISHKFDIGNTSLISTTTSLPVAYDTYRIGRDHLFVIFVEEGSLATPIHLNTEGERGNMGNNHDCELVLVCDEQNPKEISRAERKKKPGVDAYTYEGQELAIKVMQHLSEGFWRKRMHPHLHVCTWSAPIAPRPP